MAEQKQEFGAPPITAADLRMRMAEHELEDAKKAMAMRQKIAKEQEEFRQYFMNSEVTEEDRQRLRSRVTRLAEQGQSEMCVLTFSSDFCSDGGRAINNFMSDWPTTLTGRAAKLYEIWERNVKLLGFKLEARVLNYPDGIVGDIGLFLKW